MIKVKWKVKLKILRTLFILCAIACFVAVFNWPIGYYTFLRILVSIGAAAIVIKNFEEKTNSFYIFLVIFILFNPIFPIYLNQKLIWIPIDIIVGILFLLQHKSIDNETKNVIENPSDSNLKMGITKSHDKIIPPKQ